MIKTDPLMAALRQLAGGKATSRAVSQSASVAKDNKGKIGDGKDKVDQFRAQLRSIAQGAKPGPQPDIKRPETVETVLTQTSEVADNLAEATDEATTRSKDRARQPKENSPHRAGGETMSPDWRAPEATLSSVMSKLDQTRASSPPDDDATLPVLRPPTHGEPRAIKPDESTKTPKADALPEPRVVSPVGAVETRTAPAVKVVVHEQETHFEPVPQLTQLQKIIDRIAPELPGAAALPGAKAAEAALGDISQAKDAPLRMLTLQLDPPNMGAVTVRMRLVGDAVEVRLSADRQDTAQLLREERGALTDAMQSAGYSFEIASIDHGHTETNPNAGQSHTPSDQPTSQQPQGGSQFGNGTPERQSNDTQAGTRHNRQGHDQVTKPAERQQGENITRDSSGGTLYL